MSRSAPAAINRRAVRSSMGTPPTGTRALGIRSVIGRSRVPRPAARMNASTGRRSDELGLAAQRLRAPAVLLPVRQVHAHAREPLPDVSGQAVREIHAPVLPAGAPERDREAGEVALEVGAHGRIDEL